MRRVLACVLTTLTIATASGAASALPGFVPLDTFPTTPGPGGFNIRADALGDGRFILYDGDGIWVQDRRAGFVRREFGFPGDPAFIATAPDGRTVLFGGGFAGEGAVYLYDALAPALFSPQRIVTFPNHYDGDWLTDTHVLLEGTPNGAPELAIADLSVSPPLLRSVVTGKGEFSASFVVDRLRGRVYASAFPSGDMRVYAIDTLLAAFDNEAPLAFNDSGELAGAFSNLGPAAVAEDGTLLFGGETVTLIDPASGAMLDEADADGEGTQFYDVAYNRTTGRILIIGSDFGTFPPTMTGYVSTTGYGQPTRFAPLFRFWSYFIGVILDLLHAIVGAAAA